MTTVDALVPNPAHHLARTATATSRTDLNALALPPLRPAGPPPSRHLSLATAPLERAPTAPSITGAEAAPTTRPTRATEDTPTRLRSVSRRREEWHRPRISCTSCSSNRRNSTSCSRGSLSSRTVTHHRRRRREDLNIRTNPTPRRPAHLPTDSSRPISLPNPSRQCPSPSPSPVSPRDPTHLLPAPSAVHPPPDPLNRRSQ
jgi:hypothetical protein